MGEKAKSVIFAFPKNSTQRFLGELTPAKSSDFRENPLLTAIAARQRVFSLCGIFKGTPFRRRSPPLARGQPMATRAAAWRRLLLFPKISRRCALLRFSGALFFRSPLLARLLLVGKRRGLRGGSSSSQKVLRAIALAATRRVTFWEPL